MPTASALEQARAAGLDLVEVSPQAQPPVVKIVDFGKLQYEQEKQFRKSRAQSKRSGEVKCVRLTAKIGEHDMMVRVNAGQKFLDKGYKVKPELQLRGREKAHPEFGKNVVQKYLDLLDRELNIEQNIAREGWRFSALVTLKKK